METTINTNDSNIKKQILDYIFVLFIFIITYLCIGQKTDLWTHLTFLPEKRCIPFF